ncbi:hypothetical protein L0B53_12205 [Vibrio sp. SS-MA-C1-2]|uniref:PKD domain-containing protein n=1 Tax=Vibrio sp. SS-MA-C1-2 TaxID=2908646 RepID=UPI001F2D32AD|nr:hypothetical protein [Vibrio sp. SS-MA-C1-2]UJF17789.1 hypothetical protein L0B53_12205 [Vibrio sp. SS-MA-C1-2]
MKKSILSLAILTIISAPVAAIEDWQAKSYSGGSEVCLDGNHYRAKWWVSASAKPNPNLPTSASQSGWGSAPWLPLTNSDVCHTEPEIIENQSPIAVVNNILLPLNTKEATLNGSNSRDPDGDAISFEWSTVSAGISLSSTDIATPSVTIDDYEYNMVYQIRLTVSDGALTDTKIVTVTTPEEPTIIEENRQPIIQLTEEYLLSADQTSITLSAEGTHDPDGDTLSYQWRPLIVGVTIDDAQSITPTINITEYDFNREYQVQLTVSDGYLTTFKVVTLRTPAQEVDNTAPQANAGADLIIQLPATDVQLNGSQTSDPQNDVLSYTWKQLSGTPVTLKNPNTVTPHFNVAHISDLSTLSFELLVSDGEFEMQDIVTVTLKPESLTGDDIIHRFTDIDRLLEINLNHTQAETLNDKYASVLNVKNLVKPAIVTLNNIHFSENTITNNTPYHLNSVYIQQNHIISKLTLNQTIPAYSEATLSIDLNNAVLLNSQTLANTSINYQGNRGIVPQTSNSRYANAIERANAEKVHMYDQYMMNNPATLAEITTHLDNICQENSLCESYNDTATNYARDTYFAKSVSGINTTFWMDDDVWGLATSGALSFKQTKHTRHASTLWMHPALMGFIETGSYSKKIEGSQALVHELYHNFGFAHASGWPSANGVDDLFGKKYVDDYTVNIGNQYLPSDVVVTYQEGQQGTYTFKTFGSNAPLNFRLLATSELNIELTENDTNTISLRFLEIPKSSVYASFYTDNGQQMATIPLDLVAEVNSKEALNAFNQEVSSLLNQSDTIYVSTADGAWAGNFNLPNNADAGKEVHFSHMATYSSYVNYNGQQDVLRNGDSAVYRFNGSIWVKL